MRLIFNSKVEVGQLKDIPDIVRFVTNAQCVITNIELPVTAQDEPKKDSLVDKVAHATLEK